MSDITGCDGGGQSPKTKAEEAPVCDSAAGRAGVRKKKERRKEGKKEGRKEGRKEGIRKGGRNRITLS